MDPDIAGVLRQFGLIKRHSGMLYQSVVKADFPDLYSDEVKSIVEEFGDAKIHFESIRYKQKFGIYLQSMIFSEWLKVSELKALLRKIDIECGKAIGVLESIFTPLSKDDLDKRTALREELEELSEVLPDINYERNLNVAIDEYEKRDFLASALISSRVIIYALAQIPGKSDEEKVKFLREKGIIEKDRKDVHESIIKASRKARNFLSHDIKLFPTPSETLSLLGDAIGILERVSKVLKEEIRRE